jgi:hypothetical protein
MASTIAALTSGAGGISMTGDASGILNLNSNGTNVVAVTSAGVAVTGTLSATGAVSGTTGTFTGAVTTPLSYVRLNTANGYGSTNNKIRRFTNIVNNVGTDITYADSATLGGTFTINTAGVYSVSYNDQLSTQGYVGISLNSTQLTTNIVSITIGDILSVSLTPLLNYSAVTSATFYAVATSVIRAHTGGDSSGINTTQCQFTIARVQ